MPEEIIFDDLENMSEEDKREMSSRLSNLFEQALILNPLNNAMINQLMESRQQESFYGYMQNRNRGPFAARPYPSGAESIRQNSLRIEVKNDALVITGACGKQYSMPTSDWAMFRDRIEFEIKEYEEKKNNSAS